MAASALSNVVNLSERRQLSAAESSRMLNDCRELAMKRLSVSLREMLADEASVISGSDAGAHVSTICDASAPTTLLTLWGRDRKRGEQLPLEFLVRKQTLGNALSYGLRDRGALLPGMRADINVIDFEKLRVRKPEIVYDLPAGGRRLIQRADGYRHTFVAGVETLRDDELTGERPGGLLRAGRLAEAVPAGG